MYDNNDIYLNLKIRKSNALEPGKTDEYGNYIFEVEASNENLDLQNQIVLQRALMDSKDEFLKGGVISCDHLHKRKDEYGNTISDTSMVIGEPIDVRTEGSSTIVVGKLYKSNEKAQDFIRMLKDGSSRVRASVGGIFPKVVKDAKTGVEKITSVLWNDLALTTSPVNNTVGSAVFAKSMNPDEFVKALAAGYKGDSAESTNGTAIIPEDTNTKTKDAIDNTAEEDEEEKDKLSESEKEEVLKSLMKHFADGNFTADEDAEYYLIGKGFDVDTSRMIVREIIDQGEKLMKSLSFSDVVKSLTGKNKDEDDEEIMKGGNELLDDDDTLDLDFDDEDEDTDKKDDSDDEPEKTEKSDCKKSTTDDEEVFDGSELIKSMMDELIELRSKNESLEKSIKEIAETTANMKAGFEEEKSELTKSIQTVTDALNAFGTEKMPARSVMNKSVTAADAGKSNKATNRMTMADFEKARDVLITAVENGEITVAKSSKISSDMQKNMATGAPMNPEYYAFISEKMGGK